MTLVEAEEVMCVSMVVEEVEEEVVVEGLAEACAPVPVLFWHGVYRGLRGELVFEGSFSSKVSLLFLGT